MSDITRTKVLEILEHNWTSLHNPDYTDEELGKALDFCISSLETDEAYDFMYEQPEWCKDCISREQAIKEFCKQTCETPNCRFRDKGIAHASCDEVDVLKRLPSVLPKATKNDLVVDWENYKDVDGNSLDDLILEVLQNNFDCGNTYGYKVADEIIGLLPSVTPQEPRCKDCKWWKDSDGEYRRGCGAESQCPINRKEVYEGNGYCFLYEPQESEDKECQ